MADKYVSEEKRLHQRLIELMQSRTTAALLVEHGLRRTLSPLRLLGEKRGKWINIHERGAKGIMRPLGSIGLTSHGEIKCVTVRHRYPGTTEKNKKLHRFVQAFAQENKMGLYTHEYSGKRR